MSTINTANIQVGQSVTSANNITLNTDASGNLIINKGAPGALTEISRINNSGMMDATKVAFTPTGGIAATTVQGAIAEVVTDLSASSGASLVGYLPSGTGAVATTVQSKLRQSVSVFDFLTETQISQCLAGNPTFNLTPILQAYCNAENAAGRLAEVYFPRATFRLDTKFLATMPVVFTGDYPILLCNIANDFAIESSSTTAGSYPAKTLFRNLVFKWYGTFETSTTGGINFTSGVAIEVTGCIFWGLGKNSIKLDAIAQRAVITGNKFMECMNTDDIIYADGAGSDRDIYTLVVKQNLFQFTGPIPLGGKVKNGLVARSTFNLDVSDNAFEQCAIGVLLSPYGQTRTAVIRNNFFEGCTIGVALGKENGDFYYGIISNTVIDLNTFTTCDTGVTVVGAAKNVEIRHNQFTGYNVINAATATAINVTSKNSSGFQIGVNEYGVTPYASRVIGNAYPFGISSLDVTKKTVDLTGALAGWSDSFNPSTRGVTSLTTGFPSAINPAITVSFTAGATDQYVIRKTLGSTDLSGVDLFVIPFWIDDPLKLIYQTGTNTSVNSYVFAIGPDASNYWQFPMQSFSRNTTMTLKKGWNLLMYKKTDAVVATGSPASWSAVTHLVLRVQPATSSDSPVVKFSGVYGFTLNGAMEYEINQAL